METLTSNPRFVRGLALARQGSARLVRRDLWSVKSASHAGTYVVDVAGDHPACSCPDHEAHEAIGSHRCKHVWCVLITDKQIEIPSGMTETQKKPTYRQHWPSYTKAQEHEREHFDRLLAGLCEGIKAPRQTMGRPRARLCDVVFAIVTQAYVNRSGRRVISDVRAAANAGMIDASLSSKTLSKYMNDPAMSDLLRMLVRESAAPLAQVESKIAVDATGMSTTAHVRWYDEKWGRERSKRQWAKVHACVGTQTGIITDVLVTDNGKGSGDVNHLPELVTNTADRFNVSAVMADGAYLSRANLDTIDTIGAVPYIPFRAGSNPDGSPVWRRAWALCMLRHDEFKRHYHARSNVEAVFSAFKRKMGASLRTKTLVAQRNEVLARCVAFNLITLVGAFYELGIVAEFGGASTQGGGHVH